MTADSVSLWCADMVHAQQRSLAELNTINLVIHNVYRYLYALESMPQLHLMDATRAAANHRLVRKLPMTVSVLVCRFRPLERDAETFEAKRAAHSQSTAEP